MVSVYRCNLLRWAEGEDGPDTDHIVLDPIPFAELLHCDAIGLGDTPEAFRTANPVGLWDTQDVPAIDLAGELEVAAEAGPVDQSLGGQAGARLGC